MYSKSSFNNKCLQSEKPRKIVQYKKINTSKLKKNKKNNCDSKNKNSNTSTKRKKYKIIHYSGNKGSTNKMLRIETEDPKIKLLKKMILNSKNYLNNFCRLGINNQNTSINNNSNIYNTNNTNISKYSKSNNLRNDKENSSYKSIKNSKSKNPKTENNKKLIHSKKSLIEKININNTESKTIKKNNNSLNKNNSSNKKNIHDIKTKKTSKFSCKNIPKNANSHSNSKHFPKNYSRHINNNLTHEHNITSKARLKKIISSYSNKESKSSFINLQTNTNIINNNQNNTENNACIIFNLLNKAIMENEALKQTSDQYAQVINKITKENNILSQKITSITKDTKSFSEKVVSLKECQDQLILVVKIVQSSGVNVSELIEKWNKKIDNENNISQSNGKSFSDNITDLDSNIEMDSSSFIPITFEENNGGFHQKIFTGIPKLNFDKIQGNHDEEGENN